MIARDELVAYLDDYLSCELYQDYAPNGLQVEGKESISQLCTAVTASEEAIRKARALKADALLVHHGYFWKGEMPVITGMKKRRIAHLIQSDLNLLAYHLPLDCHVDIGNNACIGKLLGVQSVKSHPVGKTPDLLWSGCFSDMISPEALKLRLVEIFKQSPLLIASTEKPIKQLAWCSGAAQDCIEAAYRLGVDAYLSGEVSERTYYQAQELGIHYFACGHHATERYGIQALGEHLSERFDLCHQFIDSANPV